MTIEAGTVH